ncbi:MAG: cobalamin-dependent protein [Oligoflexales bacterium]|nr:cobalamin-dependent protein [Oligoflexales bacterium]
MFQTKNEDPKNASLTSSDISTFTDDSIQFLRTYRPKHQIRFVTATSLFDGHDASINIMRRLLQARGAEVIHLGHNRSAQDVVQAALEEDVQAIALSSYQGGHMEYFRYIRELLDAEGAHQVKIVGGGGGVISPKEIKELESHGIFKIYSPEEGQRLGLDGIIGHILFNADFTYQDWGVPAPSPVSYLARALTLLENGSLTLTELLPPHKSHPPQSQSDTKKTIPVLGLTGTGGAGKSSLLDELLQRFLYDFPLLKIAVICVDPSKKKTNGALLGDRIRINSCANSRLFLRSFANKSSGNELSKICGDAITFLKSQDFDLIVIETSGIGQADSGVTAFSDLSLYVMTPEYGAQTQLEKIDMLDFADFIAVNKYERQQGPDSVRDVRTLLRRNRYKGVPLKSDDDYPVFGTIASRFNDDGTSALYRAITHKLAEKSPVFKIDISQNRSYSVVSSHREALIPSTRTHYLSQIADSVRNYHQKTKEHISHIKSLESLETSSELIDNPSLKGALLAEKKKFEQKIPPLLLKELREWPQTKKRYESDLFTYNVRGKEVRVDAQFETLSRLRLPKVTPPALVSWTDISRFLLLENFPGSFPFTAGIFPFRRQEEDPKRQFAGEGGPRQTNERFHYLSKNDKAKRLSTAFDSVTLYGAEPHERPDIYGKVGESGVSIAHLEDMRLLYRGFDLSSPLTSVSMTINGPAPIILAMFFNAAIDQATGRFQDKMQRAPSPEEYQKIFDETLSTVRGTVQADILKEDQAQNTCIFSIEFALKMMGDMQEYFVKKSVRNYYAVSISGYHIAEAGANPITQLAFTLANGFTYVEYYLRRGLKINDFAPNLSFFFSNGLDAEYSVLGRVARRIWAIAMKDIYGGDERAQKLKYHIQTSGRSLHAQEMDFNDIRTTLQALLALYDNCNSLHTNAYDEALTTPTEHSVRRAMAIQLIINREFGPNKCENVNQGSYFIDTLTDIVEEAVLKEFEAISSRGGVLGALETQYQRSKIQEESMYYEHLKHTGELPLIGVNTFLPNKGEQERKEIELIRCSYEAKNQQLERLNHFKTEQSHRKDKALRDLEQTVLENGNVFAELMRTVRHCSLGEITESLYRVGGQYRRSM